MTKNPAYLQPTQEEVEFEYVPKLFCFKGDSGISMQKEDCVSNYEHCIYSILTLT